ncbi:MAG TPA: transcriptional regulator, partial [Paraburkholderia sp.]|nr:transcriptional regulator [Paraburkholderia sp.]
NGPNRETLDIWSDVLASAIALGDASFEARALWGMWSASQASGAARNALAFARRFASHAAQTGDTGNAVLAYRLLGIASHYVGDQQQAGESLEQLLLHCDRLRHDLPLGRSLDQRIAGRAALARVLWLRGAREQALRLAEACVADACNQQQAIVKCDVLIEGLVPLALLSGKRERAARALALLDEVSTHTGLSVAQACCRCFDAYLRSFDDTASERLPAFRAALDHLEPLEFGAPYAMLVGQYALALGRAGQRDAAIAAVAQARVRCDETGERWYAGELARIHGELLLMRPTASPPSERSTQDAEACFTAALNDAVSQGCRTLQLRAATSLGALWHAQGRSADAIQLLRPICSGLTEGLDWDDFEAATRVLLASADTAAASDASDVVLDEAPLAGLSERG